MPEIREERRIVTALFADVVGSTALAEQLDAEEARLIVGEAIARAVRSVESYGGTVKDLAGDGMFALFGAPVAHEDDPERALRAALEIAVAIADYGEEVRRGWGVEGFGVRLGVETGEVVVGEVGAGARVEYGATGDAVNVAARLQAHAEPGSVLVGPHTRRLAGDRFRWGPVHNLALKGKSEPVAAATALEMVEPTAGRQSRAPLKGREREVAGLLAVLEGLESGRGGIVFLSGEPGIGKSRLTAEMREAAAAGEAVDWLEGRAVSYGASLAWWPLRDLLRGWAGIGTQEPELRARLALRRHLEELLLRRAAEVFPYLGAILGLTTDPESAAVLQALSPEALQFQTYEVLAELLVALAARRPLVVAVDDLHWADATTIGFFERALPLAESLPIVFFFNHRPETAHASWALRERAARDFRHLVTAIDLQPLDRAAEQELLAALSEGALSQELEETILARAEGNPLFLEELARTVGEGGAEGVGLPTTLEGVILSRLDRLEPGWHQVVTAASACGRTFSLGLLEAVSGTGEDDLRRSLHHLQRLDLLNEERRWPDASYRFKHALIQEAAYRTLVSGRRRELHSRAARWLEQRYRDGGLERVHGLLAHHWLQADDAEQAAKHLRLAGEQALQEWALEEAVEHLQSLVTVLRRMGRETEAANPLFQLASTLHLAMRFTEANEAWREATALWRPPAGFEGPADATLLLGVNRVPWEADPFKGFYSANLRLSEQLHDALFNLRPGPSIEPGLARTLEVDAAGLVYLIRLQPGTTFNSGRPFTASAVVDSIKHFLRDSGDATILWAIVGAQQLSETGEDTGLDVRALDDLTVELVLRRHDPAFHLHFTQPHIGAALPGEATGPYRLERMDERAVVIEAAPDYPRPRLGNVRRVEWLPVDRDDALPRLQRSEIDAVVSFGALGEEMLTDAVEAVGPPAFMVALWPTWEGPPVDEALRRALALALDRRLLQAALDRHQQVATGGIVPPGVPGHTPAIAPAFDPEAARRWLSRSRHRGPLRAAYYMESEYRSLQIALDCWQEVLDVEIERVPIPIRDNQQASRQVHVIQMNWVAHVPDPSYFLHELLHSSSRSNLCRTADPVLDHLLERAESAPTGPVRMALYHEADRHAVADNPLMVPILYAPMFAIMKPWVEGWWEWGNPNQRFSELRVLPTSPRY